MNEKDRFEMFERVHLRNQEDLADEEKVIKLEKKHRSKWIQIIFNVVMILGLAYAYVSGYRPFDEWVYYLLAFIFVLNVILLYWQITQIEQLSDYLKKHMDPGSTLS